MMASVVMLGGVFVWEGGCGMVFSVYAMVQINYKRKSLKLKQTYHQRHRRRQALDRIYEKIRNRVKGLHCKLAV